MVSLSPYPFALFERIAFTIFLKRFDSAYLSTSFLISLMLLTDINLRIAVANSEICLRSDGGSFKSFVSNFTLALRD